MDLTLCYALAPTLLRTTQSVPSVSIASKEDDVLKVAVSTALRAISSSAGLYFSKRVHDSRLVSRAAFSGSGKLL